MGLRTVTHTSHVSRIRNGSRSSVEYQMLHGRILRGHLVCIRVRQLCIRFRQRRLQRALAPRSQLQSRPVKFHLTTHRRDFHLHPTRTSADRLRPKPRRLADGCWLGVHEITFRNACSRSSVIASWLHSSFIKMGTGAQRLNCLNSAVWLVSATFGTVRREFSHGDS